jgi:2'-5' RNA ligase
VPETRTFVAVAVSHDVRERVAEVIDALRPASSNVKWVSPENLHWTLCFLGDVDEAQLAEVCQRVAQATAERVAFTLAATGIGAFPSIDRPRTLWIGADQGFAALVVLQNAIEQSLSEMGLRGERRRFVPHLTLGRVRRGRHAGRPLSERLYELAHCKAGVMRVEEVTVFASRLQPGGPSYHVLSRAPLAAPG